MSAPPNQRTLPISAGTVIGPYLVERKLAQGGMSVLFLAHDTKLDRNVALKVMSEESTPGAARARLLREARTLAAVDHPGIVRIYGAGEHEGIPWIAMELIRGTDLKRLLAERGPVPPMRALRWVVQATEALAAAHDLGVIHRDLKPSNLLLTHDDQIKVVDFGIAKRRPETGAVDVQTREGEVLGTPAYLSPEQLEHGLADERSDVWGLGCVLFELVVGSPPFGRTSSAATTAAILRDEPIFPPHVTGPVVDVITACLRKSSFARVGSMRELTALARDALEQPNMPLGNPGGAASSERVSTVERRPSLPAQRIATIPPSSAPPPPSESPRGSYRAPAPSYHGHAIPRPSAQPPRRSSSGSIRLPAQGRIKGTAIRAGLLWFAQKYGADVVARVVDEGPLDLQAILRTDDPGFGVVASSWYDIFQIGELLLRLQSAVGIDDDAESDAYNNALAAAIAKDNVAGVYRSLFRLITTPPMLEANAQRVWRTYVDEGTLTAISPRKGELRFEVRQWVHHHPEICRVVGYIVQHVLRAVGYEALVVERTHCVSNGDAICAFDGMYLSR